MNTLSRPSCFILQHHPISSKHALPKTSHWTPPTKCMFGRPFSKSSGSLFRVSQRFSEEKNPSFPASADLKELLSRAVWDWLSWSTLAISYEACKMGSECYKWSDKGPQLPKINGQLWLFHPHKRSQFHPTWADLVDDDTKIENSKSAAFVHAAFKRDGGREQVRFSLSKWTNWARHFCWFSEIKSAGAMICLMM